MTPTEYQRRWRDKKKRSAAPRMSEHNGSAPSEAIECYEAYKVLKDAMAAIARDHRGETQQFRITELLGVVTTFLLHSTQPPARSSFLDLFAAYCAMFDLTCGGRPALFFKAKQPGDAAIPRITIAHAAQAYLAIAYAALVEGPGRRKPADAVKWLDEELKWRKLRNMVSGKDIQGWYHQVKAPHGNTALFLDYTFQSLQAELSNVSSPADAEAFAGSLLNAIALGPPPRLKLRG
jgi:hypothetical protein